MMKFFVLSLLIATIAIHEILGTPVIPHHHKQKDEPTIGETKEIIKNKIHDAAIKSHAALKAKGAAAFAIAKAPIVIAKTTAEIVGLKVKKVAAGIVATKALVVSKVAGAAAAAKAATAAKAAAIAHAAFGMKLHAKEELHDLKQAKHKKSHKPIVHKVDHHDDGKHHSIKPINDNSIALH